MVQLPIRSGILFHHCMGIFHESVGRIAKLQAIEFEQSVPGKRCLPAPALPAGHWLAASMRWRCGFRTLAFHSTLFAICIPRKRPADTIRDMCEFTHSGIIE